METARMMFRPTTQTKFPLNQNDTDNLDDTLPVEVLDCVDTTTNNDWLMRDTPFPGKKCNNERGDNLLLFNPLLSSTRYKSDGSSGLSDISTTAELGSTCCDDDEILSTGFQRVDFIPSFPAPSVEFQPLRCSTHVTNDEVRRVNVDTFEIRVDTNEFKSLREEPLAESVISFNPLRTSTGLVHENDAVKSKALRRNESVEFNPLRCSTGFDNGDAAVKSKSVQRNENVEFNPLRCSTGIVNKDVAVESKALDILESIDVNHLNRPHGTKTEEVVENHVQIRPASPDEFYFTAHNTFTNQNTVRESNTHFDSALGISTEASCAGRNSAGRAKSPTVQVSESAADQNNADDVDSDLSILMQCHLKIRNGRRIVSNLQAKPHIELSVFKNSPIDTDSAVVLKAFPTKNEQDSKQKEKCHQTTHNGLHDKPTIGKVHLNSKENVEFNFATPSAPITISPPGCVLRDELIRSNAPNIWHGHPSPDNKNGNRVQRAMDSLSSANIQKVISALAIIDSARSAPACQTLVERGHVDNVYRFLSKMNRSVAHQVACVHATSLLLDLAKYTYSRDSVWQNGERIGLLFNLMLIWVSKDNAIFLNCVTVLWIFGQDKTRANVLQRFVASQNKLLEKISAKLGTKIERATSKEPSLQPSWADLRTPRTYESPYFAFSRLCALLKQLPTRAK